MSRGARIWMAVGTTLVAGVVLAIPLAMAAMTFLQNRMHLYCSFGRMGADDPGSFVCADGIGYTLPVLALGLSIGTLLLVTALVSFLQPPARAPRALAGVAIAALGLVVLTSLLAAAPRPGFSGIPEDTWMTVMAVPSLLLGGASVLLVVTLFAEMRTAALARYGALALVVVATAAEPTILFGTVPAMLAIVVATALERTRSRASALPG